jgi:hypothetical protein
MSYFGESHYVESEWKRWYVMLPVRCKDGGWAWNTWVWRKMEGWDDG